MTSEGCDYEGGPPSTMTSDDSDYGMDGPPWTNMSDDCDYGGGPPWTMTSDDSDYGM